jgi:putative membrane protein
VIMASYGIGFFRSLLLALALTFLSWLGALLLGIRTLPG